MPRSLLLKKESSTRSTLRIVSVLNSFAPEQVELSVSEISRKARIPIATTHRILAGLTSGHLIERNPETGKYRIGVGLYLLGSLYLDTQDVIKAAEPVVKLLNELTNESVFVGVFDKGNVVLVFKEESRHAFRYAHNVGTIAPAYATAMGKLFLIELTETELNALYPEENLKPLTKKTITTKTALKRVLEEVRKTGVAYNMEENLDGIIAVAASLRSASGKPVAAMSIDTPIFRLSPEIIDRLALLVKMGAGLVSLRMGYTGSNSGIQDIQDLRSWWEKTQTNSASQLGV